MIVKEFLSVLNMQVKYQVADRRDNTVFYSTERESIYNINKEVWLDKNIYMVFPLKDNNKILDIRVY